MRLLLIVSAVLVCGYAQVVCPDGTSVCPTDNTCCKLSTGEWGCCPYPKAVCCSDGEHCCPNGYTCDVSAGTCTKKDEKVPFFAKVQPKQPNIVCPDGTSTCPADNTCCKLITGEWGCCPLPNAVCCSDHEHCCPEGYTCDVSTDTCTKSDEKIPFFAKVQPKHPDIVCPDGQSECPEGNTCCKLSSGQWGCCPLPNAVCCSDGEHCCPEGYTCDVSAGTCTKNEVTVPFFAKVQAKIQAKVPSVVCPDGQSECPEGNTCCKLSSGQWGCCPLPNAVCCSDGEHCCPEGYTCDVSAGTCTKNEVTVPFFAKVQAKARNVICPDGSSECPDGDTCCKLSSGQWGCCPLPNAVCCSDGEHCCPEGYTCDVSAGTCTKNEVTVPFFAKVQAKIQAKVPSVVCPDGQSECPEGNTCCKLSSGQWGCCPLPNAVCCSDGEHCCPEGYTCDISAGTCTKNEVTVPFFAKVQAKARNVICPDGSSECPDGNTCCKLSSGQWGCCPLPNAVCCSDGEHCCPEGYTCDVSAGTCTKLGGNTVPFFLKRPAQRAPKKEQWV